jgi:response regulator RpfG family c-di-GMP phosphodiesterase/transcriptional regulator with XRE-family HTH domain
MDEIKQILKDNLKKYRKEKNISQYTLSLLADVSPSYYSEIESGQKDRNPTLEMLYKIASVLGINICSLLSKDNRAIDSTFYQSIQELTSYKVLHFDYTLNRTAQIKKCVSDLLEKINNFKYDEFTKSHIVICLVELINNSFLYGNRKCEKSVFVAAQIDNYQVQISIKDQGSGFDFIKTQSKFLKNFSVNKYINQKKSFTGLDIVKMCCDSLKYSENGTKVDLIKYNNLFEKKSISSTLYFTIKGWTSIIEKWDVYTGQHLKRVAEYTKLFTQQLRVSSSNLNNYITEEYVQDIEISSLLHDIGKIIIPRKILCKKGKLSTDEYNLIKKHVEVGGEYIESVKNEWKRNYPFSHTYLDLATDITKYHHENWDGKGYQSSLKTDKIPLSARIVAIIDTYDSLTTKRPYRGKYNHKKAIQIITKDAGKKYDPNLVELFNDNSELFKIKLQELNCN